MLYKMKQLGLVVILAGLVTGCASVGEIRNVQVELGNRPWPKTRDIKAELGLVGEFTEITFRGEVYRGFGIHGYTGWRGWVLGIFVPAGQSGVIINPPAPSDYFYHPMGYVKIDYEHNVIDVYFMETVEDVNGDPVRLTEHPLNGRYEMKPRQPVTEDAK